MSVEELREQIEARDARLEELLAAFSDFQKNQIPGESPPAQELATCREAVKTQRRLIDGLEQSLEACQGELSQCRSSTDPLEEESE